MPWEEWDSVYRGVSTNLASQYDLCGGFACFHAGGAAQLQVAGLAAQRQAVCRRCRRGPAHAASLLPGHAAQRLACDATGKEEPCGCSAGSWD